jgi:hypothetical protein
VNALAQSRPDQRGSGDFPKTAVKIALSKSIISATVGEAGGSGSYKSREEPHLQQDARCNDLSLTGGFVIASGPDHLLSQTFRNENAFVWTRSENGNSLKRLSWTNYRMRVSEKRKQA